MRLLGFGLALRAQRHALLNAEAMLLVDDRQTKPRERHLILKQRVRADRDLRQAARYALDLLTLFLALERARQPGDLHAQRREPLRELGVVLLREDLGGRHHRNLIAALYRLQRGERRHHRLAAAHITLQQPLHRVRLRQIGADLAQSPLLSARELERQCRQQPRRQVAMLRQARRRDRLPASMMQAHRQLLGEQLVELDPAPGRMRALLQQLDARIGGRIVQIYDALLDRGQLELGDQFARQRIGELDGVERLLDELAQQRLSEARSGRVDRRQRLRQRIAAVNHAIARMDHLGAEETLAQLAHQAHARARCELFLLARIEVEEAQMQDLVAVAHAADQRALGSELHRSVLDLALDLHGFAAAGVRQPRETGLVFVAQRQVQYEIELPAHAQLVELVAHRLRRGRWRVLRVEGWRDRGSALRRRSRIRQRLARIPHLGHELFRGLTARSPAPLRPRPARRAEATRRPPPPAPDKVAERAAPSLRSLVRSCPCR
jgi:hypothetical protein